MALFRRMFYRKPPDRLLEISERIYVFDCCFSTDILEEDEYKVYLSGIVAQLQDHFPDASFMVFNFREGERRSQISDILSQYDMTVMDYPRQYEGCPLLPAEMIHHFLISSESWLSLEGQQNVLLMHCERGGWPVLAFMLAGLLLYRKQYSGEQKTLEMVYKQAPRELLHLLSLNPQPSQMRYLQYISSRNHGSDWPPSATALILDCLILRVLPVFNGESGCRPIIRVYGQDPSSTASRGSKVLFSTPKTKKHARCYRQEESTLVKIDIRCCVQGDVVLECIHLDEDLIREEMMFRVMFNTSFIRSNILLLSREEIDALWDAEDQLPKDFKAEVLFSDFNSIVSNINTEVDTREQAKSETRDWLNNVDDFDEFSDVDELYNILPVEKDPREQARSETRDWLNNVDPREKAKSEKRDWLNNVVSELESEVHSFEAEIEGLSVKKGMARPPRLTHLETSIAQHKDHIMKLELILRLLDNDELNPEEVNDVRDYYVERNQVSRGFDEPQEKSPEKGANGILSSMRIFLGELRKKKLQQYSSGELARFTEDFTNQVGSGAYGDVFIGKLPNGVQVAVKKLRDSAMTSMEYTFMAEVRTMSRTLHRNLVRLFGYCFEVNMKALVYEYLENGSFDKVLFENHLNLQWEALYEIAIGIAKGLSYLHEGCDEEIVHYDVKPGNVLLNSKLSPKVADFGLAKITQRDSSHISVIGFRGTGSYAAPEMWKQMPVTPKSDTYSFGMMLFEVLGRRRNNDGQNWLPGQVWENFKKGQLDKVMEYCGINDENKVKAKILCMTALWCTQYMPNDRPTMSDVVQILKGNIQLPSPPDPFYPYNDSSSRSSIWGGSSTKVSGPPH